MNQQYFDKIPDRATAFYCRRNIWISKRLQPHPGVSFSPSILLSNTGPELTYL